jgi:methylenetetrahydrofolate reductase (NADPH)
VRFIRAWEDRNHLPNRLTIGVAGFCEGHPDTRNRIREMDYLKAKMDEGADYICTQLFFDNHAFFDFRDRCRLVGIDVPIIAGIMPITTISGMNRMAELSAGTNFPARLFKAMLRAGGERNAIERIGINYASNQCAELLDADVDGIHFYTLNRSKATLEIYRNLGINNYFDVDRIHMLSNLYKS